MVCRSHVNNNRIFNTNPTITNKKNHSTSRDADTNKNKGKENRIHKIYAMDKERMSTIL